MRPATNSFSCHKRSIFDRFSRITRNISGIPAKRPRVQTSARNRISEISSWQKCFSKLKVSMPRISCTANWVRRSSWKALICHPLFRSRTFLSPFTVHEILELDISIWIIHCYLDDISEISFLRLWGLNRGNLIAGNPPHRRSFLFTMFPNKEPGGRGPPSKHPVHLDQVT